MSNIPPPNRRSDYALADISATPAPRQARPQPVNEDATSEFDPEQFLVTKPVELTEEDKQRVQASMNEIHNQAEQETAPKWDEPPKGLAPTPVEEVKQVAFCPQCGFDQSRDPTEVTIADKREYLRSILAEQAFTKTYTLLNGKVRIKFRARNTVVDQLIEQQLQMDLTSRRFVPSTDPEWNRHYYLARMSKLWVAASLVSYTPSTRGELPEIGTPAALEKYGKDTDTETHLSRAEQQLFQSMPLAVFNLINTTFMQFTALLTRLTLNAEHPNFWKEIDGLI